MIKTISTAVRNHLTLNNKTKYIKTDPPHLKIYGWRNLIPRRCTYCHKWETLATIRPRRMNTAYEYDPANIMVSCLSCWEHSEELWEEQWKEYYSGRL